MIECYKQEVMILNSSRLLTLSSFLGLLAILFLFRFGTALHQEKDTPDILKAAFKIELSGTDITTINSNPKRLLVRSFDALKVYLEQQGWSWTDQAGSFVTYHHQNLRLNANCVMYSRNYMICNLSEIP